MTNSLPDKPSISLLKKQAKKLLKQVRDGDSEALATVQTHHPKPKLFAGLRDAQLVIARSYGFPGWSELSDAVELARDADNTLPEKANLFIQLGCVQYSGSDRLRHYDRARRLLATYPDIAQYSFYTALVANNASAVSKYLDSDPTLARTTGGPLTWPPLLYVTYSRIGESKTTRNSLSIAKQLLDHGADPDSHVLLNNTYRFTALTGAMGEGEQGVNQPPHQYADEMVTLLLDAGANPNEGQGLYNTMFTDSADKWLVVLFNKGLHANDPLNWDTKSAEKKVATLNYQLSCAVDSDREARVQLLLDAGADPNARNTYNGRAIHTNALLTGHTPIARLLEENGAIAEELDIKDEFRLACVREEDATITSLLDSHPTLKADATLLHEAAEHASVRIIDALIAKGFDINGQSKHGRTLLHHYAMSNNTARIQDLLHQGARIDIRDSSYNSTAAGFAAHCASYDAMRLLLDASPSLLDVVCCAYLERAQTLVEKTPSALHQRTERGSTPLHVIGSWLHDDPDYDTYNTLVEWLLSVGADINARNNQGQTPIEFNLSNGSDTLAEVLSDYS